MKLDYRTILLFLVLTLSSCTVPIDLELFNNCDTDIVIIVNDENYKLRPGKIKRIKAVQFNVVFLDFGKGKYRVELVELPPNYIVWRGWGIFSKRIFRAQIERGFKIWALAAEQELPVSKFLDQPKGFPLELAKAQK